MKSIFTPMKNIMYIFLGGGIGSVLRYLFSLMIPSSSFPYATFVVNIIGSFMIGLFATMYSNQLTQNSGQQAMLLFLTTGLCGGFTTFSTFSKESVALLQQQQWGMCLLYVFLSVVLCLGGTALGVMIALKN